MNWFIIALIAGLLAYNYKRSKSNGWLGLAKIYPAREEFTGELFYQIWTLPSSKEDNTRAGSTDEGVYIKGTLPLFDQIGFLKRWPPPIFIPWQEIRVISSGNVSFIYDYEKGFKTNVQTVEFSIPKFPNMSFRLHRDLAEKLAKKSSGALVIPPHVSG